MKDYRQIDVGVGDIVLEERGVAYRVLDDELASVRSAHCVAVRRNKGLALVEHGPVIVLRVYHCFRIEESEVAETDVNKRRWNALYRKYAEADVKAEIQSHRVQRRQQLDDWEIRTKEEHDDST